MRDFDIVALEVWTDYLSYHYITDVTARTIIEAAGIDLFKCPKTVGRDLLHDFMKAKASGKSEGQIVTEMDLYLKAIEPLVDHVGTFINDPTTLGQVFRRSQEKWDIEQLAKRILDEPLKGVELLNDYHVTKAMQVESLTLDQIAAVSIEEHLEKVKNREAVIEIPGFEHLSRLIGGFNPARIGMFLAMTGFGKTNFALNLALRARLVMNVLYFNMEMPYSDMVNRCAVIGNDLSFKDFFGARFDKKAVLEHLEQRPGAFEMTNGRELTLDQITGYARFKARQKKLGLIIVDYDQKIDLRVGKYDQEWRVMQDAIKALEELAKELGCYIMVLSQMNRDGELSSSFRAAFSAHTVLKFHREDGQVYIAPLKNRHGTTNRSVHVNYSPESSKITEIDIVDAENKLVSDLRRK